MKSNVIKQILTLYPDRSSTTLARMISEEYPEMFTTIEQARDLIRYYRGQHGRKSRSELKNKTFQKEYQKRFSIPIPEEQIDYKPIKIDGEKIGIICDVHIPDTDSNALNIALDHLKNENIDSLIILGDLLDGYHLSKFTKNPKTNSFSQEVKYTTEFLEYIRRLFPDTNITYKYGNHDGARLQNYLYRQAPEISDIDALKLHNLLKLNDLGIKSVHEMQLLKIGKLFAGHGHEWGGNCSVNVARNIFQKTKSNTIVGHFHRVEEYIEKNIMTNETKGVWCVGHLQNPQPAYRPYNNWCQGFAFVNVCKSEFFVNNYKIIDGKIL